MAAGRACPGDSIFDLKPLGVMQDGSPWKGVALCLQRMAWCRLTRLHVGLPSPPAKLARHWTLQYGLGQYGGVQHLPSKRPCFDRYIMVGMGRGVRRGMGYRGASSVHPPTSSHLLSLPHPPFSLSHPHPTLSLSALSLCMPYPSSGQYVDLASSADHYCYANQHANQFERHHQGRWQCLAERK